jgi:hypothetical protein
MIVAQAACRQCQPECQAQAGPARLWWPAAAATDPSRGMVSASGALACLACLACLAPLASSSSTANSSVAVECGADGMQCKDHFSLAGKIGCCALGPDAVCCYTPLVGTGPSSGIARSYCCPKGSQCSKAGCTPTKPVYSCGPEQGQNCTVSYVCAPGPPAGSLATDLPNVVVIGDSVSIGWTPVLRQLLAGKATVLHNPNSGDGGARSTSDMLQCLKYRLSTADLKPFPANITIVFNFGLHDYNLGMAGADEYESEMRTIVKALRGTGAKLVYAATTPAHNTDNPEDNPTVVELNRRAEMLMATSNIPLVSYPPTCLPTSIHRLFINLNATAEEGLIYCCRRLLIKTIKLTGIYFPMAAMGRAAHARAWTWIDS